MTQKNIQGEGNYSPLQRLIKKFYVNPLVRGLDIDSKEAVTVHRRLIKENPLLCRHYEFIYEYFQNAERLLTNLNLPSLEIGSGGGFLKEFIPQVITSDVVKSEGIDRIEEAAKLSFPDNSLKAIYANGVLHHIKEPEKCLLEVQRVLIPRGKFVCNEPSSTLLGYFLNRYFHHEYTNKFVREWKIDGADNEGRLTQANMAMPYIIFKRDRELFRQRFKNLKIVSIIYHDFLRYSLSGGLSYRSFIPPALYGVVNFIEIIIKPLMPILGNNMLVIIQKI